MSSSTSYCSDSSPLDSSSINPLIKFRYALAYSDADPSEKGYHLVNRANLYAKLGQKELAEKDLQEITKYPNNSNEVKQMYVNNTMRNVKILLSKYSISTTIKELESQL
jgi:hypothetical protein